MPGVNNNPKHKGAPPKICLPHPLIYRMGASSQNFTWILSCEVKMLSFAAPVNVYEIRGGNSVSPSNPKKEDITTFERYTKVWICWRYHRFFNRSKTCVT
jgi:hypothetical protein